jgi:hypothetical protein
MQSAPILLYPIDALNRTSITSSPSSASSGLPHCYIPFYLNGMGFPMDPGYCPSMYDLDFLLYITYILPFSTFVSRPLRFKSRKEADAPFLKYKIGMIRDGAAI